MSITSAFIDTLKTSLDKNAATKDLPSWLCQHTRNPSNPLKPFSFEGHEFQIGIIESYAPKQSIIKCSQVGLSEVNARKGLALAYLHPGCNLIYTLPSGAFAGMFAKTRVSPIIKASPTLSTVLDKDTDNTKIKQIGSSFLYFQGTFSESAAISIPAKYVISDETCFSNQDVLADYSSRLGHNKEDEGGFIKFSTPTVEGFAISADYKKSSQANYQVKCLHCNTWTKPDFLKDVVVPDLGLRAEEINKHHVVEQELAIRSAFCECQNCKKDLFLSLLDPTRREWVHDVESRVGIHDGFRVSALDMVSINPPSRTLMQIADYKTYRSYKNFKLGLTDESSETKFDTEIVDRVSKPEPTDLKSIYGRCVAGLDVGKRQSWLTIGIPSLTAHTGQIHGIDIVKLKVFDSTETNSTLAAQVLDFLKPYGIRGMVIDNAPDFSTAKQIRAELGSGWSYGAIYTGAKPYDKKMNHYVVNQKEFVVTVDRTASLDEACALWNSYQLTVPRCKELEFFKSHLAGVRRMELEDGDARWVKLNNSEDHFVHSINYLLLAAQIHATSFNLAGTVALPPIGTASLSFETEEQIRRIQLDNSRRRKFL